MKVQQLLLRHIPIERLVNALDVLGHPFATAIVINHDFQKSQTRSDRCQILLRAIDGVERVGVPDMHPTPSEDLASFTCIVDGGVCLAQAIGPKHLPRQQLRIPQHEPPHFDVVTVYRPLPLTARIHEFCQTREILTSPLRVDAARPSPWPRNTAEASHVMGIGVSPPGTRAQRIGKTDLAARNPTSPHRSHRSETSHRQSLEENSGSSDY